MMSTLDAPGTILRLLTSQGYPSQLRRTAANASAPLRWDADLWSLLACALPEDPATDSVSGLHAYVSVAAALSFDPQRHAPPPPTRPQFVVRSGDVARLTWLLSVMPRVGSHVRSRMLGWAIDEGQGACAKALLADGAHVGEALQEWRPRTQLYDGRRTSWASLSPDFARELADHATATPQAVFALGCSFGFPDSVRSAIDGAPAGFDPEPLYHARSVSEDVLRVLARPSLPLVARLHMAATGFHIRWMGDLVLEMLADPAPYRIHVDAALCSSLACGVTGVADILIKRGANVNAENAFDWHPSDDTPISFAAECAARTGDFSGFDLLCAHPDIDHDAVLFWAVQYGFEQHVRNALAAGGDPEVSVGTSIGGETRVASMRAAVSSHHAAIVRTLAEAGADANALVSDWNVSGSDLLCSLLSKDQSPANATPGMAACSRWHVPKPSAAQTTQRVIATAQALLDHGAVVTTLKSKIPALVRLLASRVHDDARRRQLATKALLSSCYHLAHAPTDAAVELFRAFIDAGADPNARGVLAAPLVDMCAAPDGLLNDGPSAELVEAFCLAGADPLLPSRRTEYQGGGDGPAALDVAELRLLKALTPKLASSAQRVLDVLRAFPRA